MNESIAIKLKSNTSIRENDSSNAVWEPISDN